MFNLFNLLLAAVFCGALTVFSCESDYVPFGSKCIPFDDAFILSMTYLRENLNSFDEINKGSLGFLDVDAKEKRRIDSGMISEGIADVGTNASLNIKGSYSWSANVELDMFLEYVLPYGNVNEARTNWRPYYQSAVVKIIQDAKKQSNTSAEFSTIEAVTIINEKLWDGALGNTITFKSNQTPLDYDAMSAIVFGCASCTGVSIVFTNALRSVGIPARIVGTPAWNRNATHGNHNWVEVWVYELKEWKFVESKAAGGTSESFTNPCVAWFCTPGNTANGTQFFAARYDQSSSVRYPMAWDLRNKQIPGEDRTAYYQQICSSC